MDGSPGDDISVVALLEKGHVHTRHFRDYNLIEDWANLLTCVWIHVKHGFMMKLKVMRHFSLYI